MKVHESSFSLLLDNLDIIDVVQHYLPKLKKKGTTHEALCPFHVEKTPSFKVSQSKQIYKCMGCGQGGDLISFVKEIEVACNTMSDAAKLLAVRYKVPIQFKESANNQEEDQDKHAPIVAANEFALAFFKQQFFACRKAKEYIMDRGYNTKGIVDKWEIGYAPLNYHLGFDKETLKKADLINEKGQPRFRDRIIFPVRNEYGRLVGFSGRKLDNSSPYPKYVNTAENGLYEKRNVLYGLHQNKKRIRAQKYAIIVEGPTDVGAMPRAGIHNAVGVCGTSFSEGHAKLIAKHAKYCLILMDGDKAGYKSAAKIIEHLWRHNLHGIPVLCPEGEDPNSLALKYGPDLVDKVEEVSPIKVVMDSIEGDRSKKVEGVLELLARCPNALKRDDLLVELSKVSSYSKPALLDRLNYHLRQVIRQLKMKL